MSAVWLYVTAAGADEAARIGRTVVQERLCACANVLGPIRSFYWWDGAVREGSEVALVLKTSGGLAEQAVARVKALHSYDVPCVVALPIAGGNADFLDWIAAETNARD
ncbi:MAG: divalent-cation tolerance protein CutA [Proteobacteria bacterium]|nr:divalent-cation tolerance protein CutA [Pseudomonadota bacterium]